MQFYHNSEFRIILFHIEAGFHIRGKVEDTSELISTATISLSPLFAVNFVIPRGSGVHQLSVNEENGNGVIKRAQSISFQ